MESRGAAHRLTRQGSVQLKLQRIAPIAEFTEQIGQVGVIDRLAAIIGDKVLLRDIGDVIGLIVFGQQMVKRLFFRRSRLFGDGGVPFISVGKLRVDIENDTPKRVFTMANHLTETEFCRAFQHEAEPP